MPVQGSNTKPVIPYFKQFPGHHLVGVGVRDREDRLAHHFLKGELVKMDPVFPGDEGQGRKILPGLADDREPRLFTADHGLEGGVGLDRHVVVRELAHHFGKHPGVQGDHAPLLDGPGNGGLDPHFHIVGRQLDTVGGGVDQDTFENGHRRPGGDGLGDDIHAVGQVGFGTDDLHGSPGAPFVSIYLWIVYR